MKFLIWETRFETGVGEIDRRHRHEFEMINSVHKAVVEENPKEQILGEMQTFILDVEEHFQIEEELMTRLHFAGRDAHMDEHNELLERLRGYVSEFGGGEITPAYQFLELAHSWFIRHLESHDRDLGSFISQTGRSDLSH